jgi:hypothetical protein
MNEYFKYAGWLNNSIWMKKGNIPIINGDNEIWYPLYCFCLEVINSDQKTSSPLCYWNPFGYSQNWSANYPSNKENLEKRLYFLNNWIQLFTSKQKFIIFPTFMTFLNSFVLWKKIQLWKRFDISWISIWDWKL